MALLKQEMREAGRERNPHSEVEDLVWLLLEQPGRKGRLRLLDAVNR